MDLLRLNICFIWYKLFLRYSIFVRYTSFLRYIISIATTFIITPMKTTRKDGLWISGEEYWENTFRVLNFFNYENVTLVARLQIVFQHVGSPAHYRCAVREHLCERFPCSGIDYGTYSLWSWGTSSVSAKITGPHFPWLLPLKLYQAWGLQDFTSYCRWYTGEDSRCFSWCIAVCRDCKSRL